jgi:DNA-binding MarR family transcriptional regulator
MPLSTEPTIIWPQASLTYSARRLLAALHELADRHGFVLAVRSPELMTRAGGMSRPTFYAAMDSLVERGLVTRRRTREYPARSWDYALTAADDRA